MATSPGLQARTYCYHYHDLHLDCRRILIVTFTTELELQTSTYCYRQSQQVLKLTMAQTPAGTAQLAASVQVSLDDWLAASSAAEAPLWIRIKPPAVHDRRLGNLAQHTQLSEYVEADRRSGGQGRWERVVRRCGQMCLFLPFPKIRFLSLF
jgi:hypothetical protein